MDLKKMKDIVDEVITYSQNIPLPLNTEKLIERWYKGKERFIEAMNGKLIFETDHIVTFDIPEASRKSMVSDLADRFDTYYNNVLLADFIFEMRDCFFTNIMSRDYVIDDNTVVKKGAKIIKAFKYFEKDKERLVAMQNEASLLIQNAKVSGKLCLSVHPLDYLSSSENNYNWRSCHALDGEYCAGNLSYMADDVTVVCYLKGEEDTILPNFPSSVQWNNKKWRMLMFISDNDDLIFAGRQYPFHTEYALEACRALLYCLDIDHRQYSSWTDGRVTEVKGHYLYDIQLYINGYLFPEKKVIKDAMWSRHFNDLTESSYYTPIYMWKNRYDSQYPPLVIGSEVFCVKCGKYHTESSESMLCDSCYELYGEGYDEDRCVCGECGSFDWIEDMIYIDDEDRYVCQNCADSVTTFCDGCGTYYSKDSVEWDPELGETRCRHCREPMIPADITPSIFF